MKYFSHSVSDTAVLSDAVGVTMIHTGCPLVLMPLAAPRVIAELLQISKKSVSGDLRGPSRVCLSAVLGHCAFFAFHFSLFLICFLRIACLGLGTKNDLVMFTHNQIVSCICYKIQNSAIAKKQQQQLLFKWENKLLVNA